MEPDRAEERLEATKEVGTNVGRRSGDCRFLLTGQMVIEQKPWPRDPAFSTRPNTYRSASLSRGIKNGEWIAGRAIPSSVSNQQQKDERQRMGVEARFGDYVNNGKEIKRRSRALNE